MKIYPITNNLVDVFLGQDWYNWSRWRSIKGKWIQVGGAAIEHPALILKQLSERK